MDPKDPFCPLYGQSAAQEVLRQLEQQHEQLIREASNPLGDVRRLAAEYRLTDQLDHERDRILRSLQGPAVRVADFIGALDCLPDALGDVISAARLAGALELPDVLEEYRLRDREFASRLFEASQASWWAGSQLEALNSHTALSGMLDASSFLRNDTLAAAQAVLADPIPGVSSLRDAWQFLDISGVLRLPRFRVLTMAEKHRRLRSRVKASKPAPHVRRAHSLNHRYEVVLRQVIWDAMTDAYGEDWPATRLPLCGCGKLLRATVAPAETVLDTADFAHYTWIMCHEEHFETVFAKGYEDREKLREMLAKLRHLRGRSHHARTFTADDLREFATLWRLVAAGWAELVDEVDVDF